MQRPEDLIAQLVATYPDEADLVSDVVRGVLDESRRDGTAPLRVSEAVAGERVARLLRARPAASVAPAAQKHHLPRESHDVDPPARRPRASRTSVRHHSGQR
jgi:hypothetical protein